MNLLANGCFLRNTVTKTVNILYIIQFSCKAKRSGNST